MIINDNLFLFYRYGSLYDMKGLNLYSYSKNNKAVFAFISEVKKLKKIWLQTTNQISFQDELWGEPYRQEIHIGQLVQKERDFHAPAMNGRERFNFEDLKTLDFILFVNSKTLFIPKLYFYNELDEDAYFWVGKGVRGPDRKGFKVPYGDQK